MEYTAERTEDEITLLLSLLKIISMIQISCWYNKGNDDKIKLEHIAIMCSNREKKRLSTDNMNTKYKGITTLFVLNTVLHHVGILWIV